MHAAMRHIYQLQNHAAVQQSFFFGEKPTQRTPPADTALNVPIYVVCKIIKNVMESAAGAVIGTCYINTRKLLPIRVYEEEMGNPQGPTPVQVDNTTAVGFVNKTSKQKMSKEIDIRLYWLQDRKDQGQFTIYWIPGLKNPADYHSKHHPPSHHTVMRPTIFHSPHYVNCLTQCLMQGCVGKH